MPRAEEHALRNTTIAKAATKKGNKKGKAKHAGGRLGRRHTPVMKTLSWVTKKKGKKKCERGGIRTRDTGSLARPPQKRTTLLGGGRGNNERPACTKEEQRPAPTSRTTHAQSSLSEGCHCDSRKKQRTQRKEEPLEKETKEKIFKIRRCAWSSKL